MHRRQILPQQILPTKYELTIEPNLETFTFSGELKLHADVREATAQLQLNSEELVIQSVSTDAGDGKVSYQPEVESVTFDFPAALAPGPRVFTIRCKCATTERWRTTLPLITTLTQ